jgi:hypothetical protein
MKNLLFLNCTIDIYSDFQFASKFDFARFRGIG